MNQGKYWKGKKPLSSAKIKKTSGLDDSAITRVGTVKFNQAYRKFWAKRGIDIHNFSNEGNFGNIYA